MTEVRIYLKMQLTLYHYGSDEECKRKRKILIQVTGGMGLLEGTVRKEHILEEILRDGSRHVKFGKLIRHGKWAVEKINPDLRQGVCGFTLGNHKYVDDT